MKTHTGRRSVVLRHVHPVESEQGASLIERMKACVLHDRAEALASPQRDLLLQVAGEDATLIRDSLGLCERIARSIAQKRR